MSSLLHMAYLQQRHLEKNKRLRIFSPENIITKSLRSREEKNNVPAQLLPSSIFCSVLGTNREYLQ